MKHTPLKLKYIYALLLTFITVLTSTTLRADINIEFDLFKHLFLETYWHTFKDDAVYNGRYEFADKPVVYDYDYRANVSDFIANKRKHLKFFEDKQTELSIENQTDYLIIQQHLDKLDWYQNTFQEYTWNPASYNLAEIVGVILNSDYAPLEERLKTITKRLYKSKEFYKAAQNNIIAPTEPHYKLAIEQHKGTLKLFKEELPEIINNSKLSEEDKQEALYLSLFATREVMYYQWWLENTKIVWDSIGYTPFRIGREDYEQKFKHDIASSYSAEEIYQQALKDRDILHENMLKVAVQLWDKYYPDQELPRDQLSTIKLVINKVAEKHVSAENFFDSVKNQIPALEKFIIEHDLLDYDPSKPLVIRKMPEYMRGIAGASISPPGPYDQDANTYYNVAPLDSYTDEEANSFLKEYNDYMMQILNIHEAIPGHYVQLVHSNKSPSLIKSVFGNGAMVEGWAVYAEKMMLENGYGEGSKELLLMYYKWNLRSVINTILDYSVHVLNMTEDTALELLINQGFQEKTEAQEKWKRVMRSQVQLTSYYTGFKEIYDLRERIKQHQGSDFSLKQFHNEFLSYGSAPVPVIAKLMES